MQSFVQRMIQVQALFDDGDQHVGNDGCPEAPVDGDRKFLDHNELHIVFDAGHKEGAAGLQLMQPGKVDIRLAIT